MIDIEFFQKRIDEHINKYENGNRFPHLLEYDTIPILIKDLRDLLDTAYMYQELCK